MDLDGGNSSLPMSSWSSIKERLKAIKDKWDDIDDYEESARIRKRRALEVVKIILPERKGNVSVLGEGVEGLQFDKEMPYFLQFDLPSIEECVQAEKEANGRVPMVTGWSPSLWIKRLPIKVIESIRMEFGIIVDGEDIPPPIKNFKDMKFPNAILEILEAKGIAEATAIQMQGIPVALSGRDMFGIACTGSGKTLTYVLPMIMGAWHEELMMPIVSGEGPFGLVICPSGELARQSFEVLEEFLNSMGREHGYTELRALLCIGGVDMRSMLEAVKRGVHIVVATPGVLNYMLANKKMSLDKCRYVTVDDICFEEDIQKIFHHLKGVRQTLLFSATVSTNTLNFARSALVKPVMINV